MARPPLIVRGEVGHTRHHPKVHAFRYRAGYLVLPLVALQEQASGGFGPLKTWGLNRKALLEVRSQDHAARGESLVAWARTQLQRSGLDALAAGFSEVWLVAFPRVLGYAFKPVSFYMIEGAGGDVQAVIAEVHNTFDEEHVYVLPIEGPLHGRDFGCDKAFYVSPFFPVQGRYVFRFAWTTHHAERQVIRIEYWDGERKMLSTHMGGVVAPLTPQSALGAFMSLPWQSLTITLRIHWQALGLWLKGMTFFSRSSPR